MPSPCFCRSSATVGRRFSRRAPSSRGEAPKIWWFNDEPCGISPIYWDFTWAHWEVKNWAVKQQKCGYLIDFIVLLGVSKNNGGCTMMYHESSLQGSVVSPLGPMFWRGSSLYHLVFRSQTVLSFNHRMIILVECFVLRTWSHQLHLWFQASKLPVRTSNGYHVTTYGEHLRRSKRLASALSKYGVKLEDWRYTQLDES